jgi:hypothetical protein
MCESALKLCRNRGKTKRSLDFSNLADGRQRVGIGLEKCSWRI